jgi:hypothetical protein
MKIRFKTPELFPSKDGFCRRSTCLAVKKLIDYSEELRDDLRSASAISGAVNHFASLWWFLEAAFGLRSGVSTEGRPTADFTQPEFEYVERFP